MTVPVSPWQLCDRFLELHSPWLTVVGEHLQDHQGRQLQYWRVEKADSVIILPLQAQHLLLPDPTYRPGVGAATLDFPGGRVPADGSPLTTAPVILQRELGLPEGAIDTLTPINSQGWAVNSSFSNQKLYGFIASLTPNPSLLANSQLSCYPTTSKGIQDLLQVLTCLQCRALLLEWWLQVQQSL